MRVLIFGQTGQVARALAQTCPHGVHARFLSRTEADLGQPSACAARIVNTDIVINAAAYTAVDRAEADEQSATLINGTAPGAMARACAEQGIPFLHLSSDYVFDGSGSRPRTPHDKTAPINAYGRSKLAGEHAVQAAGGLYVILRTSWVFSAHGGNFLKTMLHLSEDTNTVDVVADQIGGPTPADAIARALWVIAQALHHGLGQGGVFHFAGKPEVSWAAFARAIFAHAGQTTQVLDTSSQVYGAAAERPLNSRLNCRRLETVFGVPQPDWLAQLPSVLAQLKEPAL